MAIGPRRLEIAQYNVKGICDLLFFGDTARQVRRMQMSFARKEQTRAARSGRNKVPVQAIHPAWCTLRLGNAGLRSAAASRKAARTFALSRYQPIRTLITTDTATRK